MLDSGGGGGIAPIENHGDAMVTDARTSRDPGLDDATPPDASSSPPGPLGDGGSDGGGVDMGGRSGLPGNGSRRGRMRCAIRCGSESGCA